MDRPLPLALQLIVNVLNAAEKEMATKDYLHFLEAVRDTASNRIPSVKHALKRHHFHSESPPKGVSLEVQNLNT